MFDSHIHTNNSSDSKQTIDQVCKSAIEHNLSAISICDHTELSHLHLRDYPQAMKNSIKDVKYAQEKYKGTLKILQGIEVAEFFWNEKEIPVFMSLADYDVILGSVHRVKCPGHDDSFSRVVLDKTPPELLHEFLRIYFEDMIRMIQNYDFDVLSHLTVPLRYINGKYNRGIDISEYYDVIDTILNMIKEKNIALEVNTSGLGTKFNECFPGEDIIRRYKEIGGSLITIGSDAHTPDRVGYGFTEAKALLKKSGFDSYYYYEKRKPVKVMI